jgi:hypothetical protein
VVIEGLFANMLCDQEKNFALRHLKGVDFTLPVTDLRKPDQANTLGTL